MDPPLHYQMIRVSQDVWTIKDTRGRVYIKEVTYEHAVRMMKWLYTLPGPIFL